MFRHRRRGDRRPSCYACRQDGIYDRSASITWATVRVQVPFEPYALNLCDRHLDELQHEFSGNSVEVTQRYGTADAVGEAARGELAKSKARKARESSGTQRARARRAGGGSGK